MAAERLIEPIVGRWWVDEGQASGVWPCEVLASGYDVFGVRVRVLLGPNEGETYYTDHARVYDSAFHRVREARKRERDG